jgi:hypothetical protein
MVRTRLNNSLFQTIKFSLPVVIAITLILTSSGGVFAYNDYDNPPCYWSYTSGQRKTLYWQYGSSNIFDEWRQAYSASLIDWTNATNRVGFTWSSSASNKLYMYVSIDGRGGYTIWSCSGSIMVKFDADVNDYYDPGTANTRRSITGHELGHGVSLGHSYFGPALMGDNPDPETYYTPQWDDQEGIYDRFPW